MKYFLALLLNEKLNASPRSIKLVLSYKHSVTTDLRLHKFQLLEIPSWDWPETFEVHERMKIYKQQEEPSHYLLKRNMIVLILSDTNKVLSKKQS